MDPRRSIPRTDDLLKLPEAGAAIDAVGRDRVRHVITQLQQLARAGELPPGEVTEAVVTELRQLTTQPPTQLRQVLNATGIVLHTNAGRASLSGPARQALQTAAGYVDVELDLTTGRRSSRGRATLAALREVVPTAGDVLAVNNGAAALLLATTLLATRPGQPGREILVSRGEMVEIGDGFRLPDLIESAGARLKEVGTTNRTRLSDYAEAITENTAAILKVHPSNFRVEGFTSAARVKELATLGLPVIADVGSGLLHPHPLLPDEPDVSTALNDGAAVVTASGDKLFGGPQAGLIFGEAELVQRIRRHPMARAMRLDKLTLAALEATAAQGHSVSGPGPGLPTWQALTAAPEQLHARCDAVAAALHAAGVECEVVPSTGAVGGGGAPGLELPGWAIAVAPSLAHRLRTGTPAVLARIADGRTLIDLRCIPPQYDSQITSAILAAVEA